MEKYERFYSEESTNNDSDYTKGYDDGWSIGKAIGFEDGHVEGYVNGYKLGKKVDTTTLITVALLAFTVGLSVIPFLLDKGWL